MNTRKYDTDTRRSIKREQRKEWFTDHQARINSERDAMTAKIHKLEGIQRDLTANNSSLSDQVSSLLAKLDVATKTK